MIAFVCVLLRFRVVRHDDYLDATAASRTFVIFLVQLNQTWMQCHHGAAKVERCASLWMSIICDGGLRDLRLSKEGSITPSCIDCDDWTLTPWFAMAGTWVRVQFAELESC